MDHSVQIWSSKVSISSEDVDEIRKSSVSTSVRADELVDLLMKINTAGSAGTLIRPYDFIRALLYFSHRNAPSGLAFYAVPS